VLARRHVRRWLPDAALILTMGLGLWLRLQYLDHPLAEAHRWRQVTNADIARNFARHSLNIFYPEASWGGPVGYLSMEFPLLQWIAAVLFRLFGESERICRLVSIAFSIGTLPLVYDVGRRLFGRPVGRAAAFLMAVSPSLVFFGRTFISDVPMLFFSVAAVLAYVVHAETGRRGPAVLGAACTALAGLVKLPALLILAPIAWIIWRRHGWRTLRDPWIGPALTAAVLLTGAWYWHGDRIYHLTGLGQAILHPSGTYAPDIALAARPMMGVSHWTNYQVLATWDWYRTLGERLWSLHLTPVGAGLALCGLLCLVRIPRRSTVDMWLLAAVAVTFVAAQGNYAHEFHQLPLLPPLALYFGLAAARAFDAPWLREVGGRWWGPVASAGLVTALALISFDRSGVVPILFRPDRLDYLPINAGAAISRVVAPDQLMVVVEYETYGSNSPILLYRADRRGWSFDLHAISPHVIDRLKSRYGATYFATTMWSAIEAERPDVVTYLRAQTRIALDGVHPDAALFRLDGP